MSIEQKDASTYYLDGFGAYKELSQFPQWSNKEKLAGSQCLFVMDSVCRGLPLSIKERWVRNVYPKVDVEMQVYNDRLTTESPIQQEVGAFWSMAASRDTVVLPEEFADKKTRVLRLLGIQSYSNLNTLDTRVTGSIYLMDNKFSKVIGEKSVLDIENPRDPSETLNVYAKRVAEAIREGFDRWYDIMFFLENYSSKTMNAMKDGKVDYSRDVDGNKVLHARTDPRILAMYQIRFSTKSTENHK